MEGEIRKRAVKRCVIGSLARIMRGRNVSMEVERVNLQGLIKTPQSTLFRKTWDKGRSDRSV